MTEEELHYHRALGDMADSYLAFRPPQNKRISQSAQRNLIVAAPGTAPGPWNPMETPYMVEPMDMLGSRLHDSVVFAGPARTGKTLALLIGWMTHAVVNDPGDMLFIQMTQDEARRFSKTDVSRALDNSPALRSRLSAYANDRNTHDVKFRHGMMLRIAWPTLPNVSSATYRYTAVTDYDRIKNREDVDGEGNLFGLQKKRTTTFLSRGMNLAESSPGEMIEDPDWKPRNQHEAPPLKGILGLYNLSDRRRWYWRCPDCRDRFEAEPGLGLFHLPTDSELIADIANTNIASFAKHYARVVCPHCGSMIPFKHRHEMNLDGKWLAAGQEFVNDERVGEALQATSVGYWLGGVAAVYQKWENMLAAHLNGLKEYALNGSEETLKRTANTDQGIPYTPRYLVEAGQGRKTSVEMAEDLQRRQVPAEARCLLASVDVQGGQNARFVVQVHAVGANREQWLVDRYDLKWSNRPGMGTEFAPIDPASYPEDWDVLTDKVVLATYPTPIPGRELRIRRVIVDSGGEDGVTHNAYAWFRRMRVRQLTFRMALYKGGNEKKAPILREVMVGKRSGTNDKADVPLYYCNPHLLSDIVDNGLRRQTPGPGYYHFPKPRHPTQNPNGWLPQAFFDELTAEVRNPATGMWEQKRARNESFDLCRMITALTLQMGLDKITDWLVVPAWLAPLEQNSDIVASEDRRVEKENVFIGEPAPVRVLQPRHLQQRRPRRSAPSPYLTG